MLGRAVAPSGLPSRRLGEFSPERVIAVLDQHGVEYLVVGGVAARAYGATRETKDFDCLVRRARDNLDRLAAAMRELHARLRVHGLSQAEAAQLPMQIDATTLNAMEISTWSTDAGDLDVLVDIPGRDGVRRQYEDLAARAHVLDYSGVSVRVAGLDDIIASKEWANRPKDRAALPELHELSDRARRPRPGDERPPSDSGRPIGDGDL